MNSPTPARSKHVPVRMCVVCRDKVGKRTLTRVVRTEQGLQIDPGGKMNGRGAYLCDRESCWETAVKTDLLAKALRMPLTEEDRERLRRARA
jgi:predicted RNA-binding protein YlxR (DUF448 family)